MNKLLTLLALFCLATTILADDCRNPLLSVFGFTALSEPTTVTGLKYCKSLQAGKSCCSAETINSIQEKAKNLGQRLSAIVAKRDKTIVETREKVIPGLQKGLQALKTSSTKALQKLSEKASRSGNQQPQTQSEMEEAIATAQATLLATVMQRLADEVTGSLPKIKSGFKGFQKTRTSCVVELLKLQASAYCLACDPAYAAKGVTGTTIPLSDRVCKRLQSSCFRFLAESASQSAILAVKAVSAFLDKMAAGLEKIANDDATGLTDLTTTVLEAASSAAPGAADASAAPVTVPAGCTSENQCTWVCDNLFHDGQVDESTVTTGGVLENPTAAPGGRLLAEEEEGSVVEAKLQKRRVLAAGQWDPDQDEAGVTVNFADDPAGVGEESANGASMMKSSLLLCVVGVLSVLLF